VKLQIVGLSDGFDELVIRGDPSTGRTMSVLYLKKKQLLSVDAINSPRDFVQGKRLILSGATLNSDLLCDQDLAILDAEKGSP
jgi:3-phenylpropionate/trans-cinnamate dioxygenase ferredoxin reductase subunit